MRFSLREIKELLKAWILISLAFAIAFGGLRLDASMLVVLGVSLFTVGIGFVLHELAHKFVAQRYGAQAEFRAFNQMLVFALVTSLFGIILAVPGAVFITSPLRRDQHGKVALAGPLTNAVLALGFAAMVVLFPWSAPVASFGLRVNAWLGLFNLIPFLGADGEKVLAWHKGVYAVSITVASFVMVLAYLV